MKIVEKMYDGPVDVVGDIHGQLDALRDLLAELGYSPDGDHPENRKLVFVGDLLDRGPDSPGVVAQVRRVVEAGNGQCVLGNHELNSLRGVRKLDNGWFFGDPGDGQTAASPAQREEIAAFLATLPLALERDDLRVVHACWHPESIDRLNRDLGTGQDHTTMYAGFQEKTNAELEASGKLARFNDETAKFGDRIHFGHGVPGKHWPDARLLEGHATVNEARQMGNPIAVLTCGEERAARRVYPAGGKFRFTERVAWWDNYHGDQAIIVGHYWRLCDMNVTEKPKSAGIDLFAGVSPAQWLGPGNNVYCVDFSVGGRANGHSPEKCRLAAVRWPEATVMFDDGEEIATAYGNRAS
jgi:hypothetical protein